MPSLLQSIRDQINCRLILVAIADKYAHGNGRLTMKLSRDFGDAELRRRRRLERMVMWHLSARAPLVRESMSEGMP